jgi:hypothetical protein
MAGGGRYVIVVEGPGEKRQPIIAPTHDPQTDPEEVRRIEREGERFRYVPPFARDIVEEREREQRKETSE